MAEGLTADDLSLESLSYAAELRPCVLDVSA